MANFATTRWSMILDARSDPQTSRRALEAICSAYRRPVLAFIRRCGHAADAEDLAQEFFTRLLETRWDTQADPARGRFRSFLLTALKHFLLNCRSAAEAGKRGGRAAQVPLDEIAGALAGPASLSPEQVFERAWALTVIERAFERLSDEASRAGKRPLFERLAPFLGEGAEPADYRVLAEELAMRPNTVAVTVHRLRGRLRELVQAELSDQTDGPQTLVQELRAMRAALLSDAGAAEETA